MFRKISASFFFLLLSFIFPFLAKASGDYDTSANVEYKIQESGLTLVTYTVNITNLTSHSSPKKFLLHLNGNRPENIKAYEAGRILKTSQTKNDGDLIITVEFSEFTAGKAKTKTFIVSYEDSSITRKNGEVWEITVPKLLKDNPFNSYKAILSVPKSFGEEAYLSVKPKEQRTQEDRNLYFFDKENIERVNISAGFGKFQVYSFKLKFHLLNEGTKPDTEEVAIPPDTATQKVFYKEISPRPENVSLDEDGNWIAKYKLDPGQKIDVEVTGWAQIFSRPVLSAQFNASPEKNLSATSYWQTDSQEIKALAGRLEGIESIYKYVGTNLKYNFLRSGAQNERLGAVEAVKNPENSLCMEFTDLFIALSRAKGIPAREINGFAYSQNNVTEPLSLVADVLHSWPEYWDKDKKVFVPTDPTWASTSGGADYFKSFDLKHISFVIHGQNSVKPYGFGSYKFSKNPKDDISMSFGELPEDRYPKIKVSYDYSRGLPLFSASIILSIENSGLSADYGNKIDIVYPGNEVKKSESETVLPFSVNKSEIKLSYGLLALKAPANITVKTRDSEILVPTKKGEIIINQLLVFCLACLILLIAFQIRNKITKTIRSAK